MLLTPDEIAAAEEALFETGVEAEPLMDKAGLGIALATAQFFPRPGLAVAFVGDGHNGGDALVALRHLRTIHGWRAAVRLVNSPESLRPLTRRKLEQLGDVAVIEGDAIDLAPGEPLLLIDGLLGIGAKGELRPNYRAAAEAMNGLRERLGGDTVAVDIPSGLDGVDGTPHPGAVVADLTCTITYAKAGLVADTAADHVGRLALVPLEEIVAPEGAGDSNALLATPASLRRHLPRRAFDTHKGTAGRAGVIAGSPGMTGAAALTTGAALRGGAGLVTAFGIDPATRGSLERTLPREAMTRELSELADTPLDAIAIGPGLGPDPGLPVLDAILSDARPAVIDADGLNLLAEKRPPLSLRYVEAPRLLTPHPGEMKRLEQAAGLDPSAGRRARAEALAELTGATVLLKGARTVVATSGQATVFNTTGNPGMATPGVGDTLTGLIVALLAAGIAPHPAASLASWINGRAAELAVAEGGGGPEALVAGDLPRHYGQAFTDLRRGAF